MLILQPIRLDPCRCLHEEQGLILSRYPLPYLVDKQITGRSDNAKVEQGSVPPWPIRVALRCVALQQSERASVYRVRPRELQCRCCDASLETTRPRGEWAVIATAAAALRGCARPNGRVVEERHVIIIAPSIVAGGRRWRPFASRQRADKDGKKSNFGTHVAGWTAKMNSEQSCR